MESNSSLPCLMDSYQCSSIAIWPQVLTTPLQLTDHLDFWSLYSSRSLYAEELPIQSLGIHTRTGLFAFRSMQTKSGLISKSHHHLTDCAASTLSMVQKSSGATTKGTFFTTILQCQSHAFGADIYLNVFGESQFLKVQNSNRYS